MPRLILASASPYRLELLQNAGFDVTAFPSEIEEPDLTQFADIEAGLVYLAQLKARAVASQARGIIFAADTVGLVEGRPLGKPADREEAKCMLQAISGTAHEVLTGWCLLRTADRLLVSGVERTRIVMRAWTEAELEAYLAGGEWEGKCGGYGLQLDADPFVTRIEGSRSNVIGVPLERLQAVLAEFPALADQ